MQKVICVIWTVDLFIVPVKYFSGGKVISLIFYICLYSLKKKRCVRSYQTEISHLSSVRGLHINALMRLSATSVTLTMLRLTSPFGEGDGRCVHISDYLILIYILFIFYY